MVRAVRVVVLALLVLGLGACQNLAGPSATAPGRIERILGSGELRVALSGDQPPLNMRNRSGDLIGLEVELVQALADSMGVQPRFEVAPFRELLPMLERGEVDLVISGVTITPERNARVAFAGPYLISGKSLLTKSEAISSVGSASALDDAGRRYAALAGSTSEQFVRAIAPSAQLVATADYEAAVRMVLDDEVDAMIADFPICALSVLRYPEAGLSRHPTPFTIEPLGIALPADDPLLVNLVQNYLRTLEETGILTRLKAKWFSRGDWIADLP